MILELRFLWRWPLTMSGRVRWSQSLALTLSRTAYKYVSSLLPSNIGKYNAWIVSIARSLCPLDQDQKSNHRLDGKARLVYFKVSVTIVHAHRDSLTMSLHFTRSVQDETSGCPLDPGQYTLAYNHQLPSTITSSRPPFLRWTSQ